MLPQALAVNSFALHCSAYMGFNVVYRGFGAGAYADQGSGGKTCPVAVADKPEAGSSFCPGTFGIYFSFGVITLRAARCESEYLKPVQKITASISSSQPSDHCNECSVKRTNGLTLLNTFLSLASFTESTITMSPNDGGVTSGRPSALRTTASLRRIRIYRPYSRAKNVAPLSDP